MKPIHCLIASAFVLTAGNAVQAQTCNSGAITINDNAAATPYPSTINIAGGPTSITTVTVTLNGLTHTFPDDIDILLVGPGGQNFEFQSDAGGADDVAGLTYTVDDAAGSQLPDGNAWVAGTFQPADYAAAADPFPAPAPAGPYNEAAPSGAATFSSVFTGTDANGVWSLYVVDDAAQDVGSFAGGWCLTFTGTPVELQSFEVE